jgi:hypothetical protein
MAGEPCPPPASAPSATSAPKTPFYPFDNRIEFELADFLYRLQKMPEAGVDTLMDIWAADTLRHNDRPPFACTEDMLRYSLHYIASSRADLL